MAVSVKADCEYRGVNYLSDRVVDIHGRHGQFAGLGELVQTMDPGHAFLNDPLDHVKHGGVALQHQVSGITTVIQNLKITTKPKDYQKL